MLRLFRRYSCGRLFPESGIPNMFKINFQICSIHIWHMVIYIYIIYSIYIYILIYKPHVCLVVAPILSVMVMGRQSYTTCQAMAHLGLTLGWKVGDLRPCCHRNSCDFLWQCFLQKKMDGTNLIG